MTSIEPVAKPEERDPNPTCDERQEYFKALQKWVLDAYAWESVSSSLAYMIMSNEFNELHNGHRQGYTYDLAGELNAPVGNVTVPDTDLPVAGQRFVPDNIPGVNHSTPPLQAVLCQIPPVWKRVIAEFLDFLILFFLKLAITFVAIDFFDAINLENYGAKVVDPNGRINYKMVVAATSQVLVLEFIHRVIVCIFEACWLHKGRDGEVGGATPGKALMGLRVLLCSRVENIDSQPNYIVLVYPGTDLGWGGAIARAILKNIILAVLFPMCFALFFFKHHRTGYDVVCRSIVVERPHRHRH